MDKKKQLAKFPWVIFATKNALLQFRFWVGWCRVGFLFDCRLDFGEFM